jgi:hypothetical protein
MIFLSFVLSDGMLIVRGQNAIYALGEAKK